MSTHQSRLRRRHLLLAVTPLLLGLVAVACGSDPQATPESSTATSGSEVSTSLIDTTAVATTVADATTSTVPTPAPATTTKPKPASTTTTAAAGSGPNLTIVITPVTFKLLPKITSATTQLNWTCAQANQAGLKATVTWTSSAAVSVTLVFGPGPIQQAVPGSPANGSGKVTLQCGKTIGVSLIPVAADGTTGTAKKLSIIVGA